MRHLPLLFCLLAACDCGSRPPSGAGRVRDAGADEDTGVASDAGDHEDGGPLDAQVADAAPWDTGGLPDSGLLDTGLPDSGTPDAGTPDAGTPDAGTPDAGTPDAGTPDTGTPDAGALDAGGTPVFDVEIFVANTCDVSTNPASITVPAGTAFEVNWVNLPGSASNVDIDKIDQFNQVPLIIGLEPGNSWHDTIREWCGQLFMGTFSFRITGCFDPYYLDVDCSQ